jgi:acyl-CoA synthetase (AMP-forming)/AMP-acid ligase II
MSCWDHYPEPDEPGFLDHFSSYWLLLRQWKELRPHAVAIQAGDQGCSWSSLHSLAEELVRALECEQIQPGDRVLVHLAEGPSLIAAIAALDACRGVYVPVNTRFPGNQKAALARLCSAKFLLLDCDCEELAASARPCGGSLMNGLRLFAYPAADQHRSMTLARAAAHRLEEDFAVAVTSATTGAAKAIMVNQFSTLATGNALATALRITAEDAILPLIPLTSHLNLCCSIPALFVSGARLLIRQVKSELGQELGWAQSHNLSVTVGVPTNYVQMLALLGAGKIDVPAGLRGIVAGSVCDESVVRSVRHNLELQLCNHYGMSEFGGVSSVCLDDSDEDVVYRSAGRPFPWVETTVAGPDGIEPSEIMVRGPGLFRSALTHIPEMQKRVSADDWLHTGDFGVFGRNGELRVSGRSGDMAIRSGNNVFFAEVESAFRESAAIEDVIAFCIPDPVLGEAICACLVPLEGKRPTPEEMFAFAAKHLPSFKIPDFLAFVPSIPANLNGKLLRRSMQHQAVSGELLLIKNRRFRSSPGVSTKLSLGESNASAAGD